MQNKKLNRRSFRILLIAALALIASSVASAQFENGNVVGTIRDTSGAAVQGAKVNITNVATGVVLVRETDGTGSYSIPSLRSGTYKITATKEGYAVAKESNVVISVGTTRRVDLTLHVGTSEQVIQVTATDLQLETDTSQRGQIITQRQIEDLPLSTLDYSDLALLATGVTAAAAGVNSGDSSLVRTASFNVNGQRSMYNNFLLDGMDNNAHGTSNQGFSNEIIIPNPDAISQFQIVTNNESAEYGRASGATINVAYKSGTNAYHFELFEYLRNTAFNAIGYFPSPGAKPVLQRNQFGGNVGGPFWKNKLFFFGDIEVLRQRRTLVNYSNVFKLSDRALIMAPTASNTTYVTDPYTGATYQANQPLPQGILSPIMYSVLENEPMPNVPGVSPSVATNNYVVLQRFSDDGEKYNLRLDQQWNERTSSFVRLSQSKELAVDGVSVPLPYDGGTNGNQSIMDQQLALGVTHQVGANQLLEVRLGVSYTKGSKTTLSVGYPTQYNIPGLPTDPRVVGGIPTMAISGYQTIGRQPTNPQWQYPFLLDPRVNYSIQHGRHTLKMGYEYQYVREIVQDAYPLYGEFTFAGKFSGYLTSDFLFGAPSLDALASYWVAHVRNDSHFAYFQDDWRVANGLTLNLGLRYEYGSPYWDKDNELTNFDPATSPMTGELLHAKNGSMYDRSLVEPDKNDFGPRVGFAYSATPTTVLRGGFGISFIHYNRDGELSLLAINAPQAIFASLSQVPAHAISSSGTPTPTFYSVNQGFPANLTAPANYNSAASTIKYVPKTYRDPYVESYFMSVQKQIAKNRIIDIAYVGNHSLKLEEIGNFNQANPALGRASTKVSYTRPIPNFADIAYSFNGPGANYNGLQVRYEDRGVGGLIFLNSFTYSRTFDFASANAAQAWGNGSGPQNIYNISADYGPSQYDVPLIDTASVIYNLPFGRGRRFMNKSNAVLNTVLGGWELSAINNMHSGNTYTPEYSPSAINSVSNISHSTSSNNGANNYRPWRIPGMPIRIHSKLNRTLQMYNTSTSIVGNIPADVAFTTTNPTSVDSPFGNAARNPARSDALFQLDAGIYKSFPLPIGVANLQFRAQAYNIMNKTNFQPPGESCCGSSFGVVTAAYQPRILQFALKLTY